jgi:hypothetical protein
MSNASVSPEARRLAAEFRECPMDHTIRGLTDLEAKLGGIDMTLDQAHHWQIVVADQKPDVYGRFARIMKPIVEPVVKQVQVALAAKAPEDPFGLRIETNSELKIIQQSDIDSWESLCDAWEGTLIASANQTLKTFDPYDLTILRRLWAIRNKRGRTLEEQLLGGINTAIGSCATIAFGMGEYLDSLGMPTEKGVPIIGRSPGPILETTGLELRQFTAFSKTYLGLRIDEFNKASIHFEDVRTDIYKLGQNNRANYTNAIEEFRDKDGRRVADVPQALPGQRIGCPILLNPREAQRLYGALVMTAARAELL